MAQSVLNDPAAPSGPVDLDPDPMESLRQHRWTTDGVALVPLLLLTALVAWNRVTFDGWLGRFDVATFFLPWYSFLGDRLRHGDVPGWNPHLFAGTPFAGDPESGWMYLPAMVWFAALPTLNAMKAMVATQLVIAGISTYGYGRVLGLGVVGALVASVAFTFGPFLHWNTYCCLVFAEFATWIPLALLGIELALRASHWVDRITPWFVTGLAVSQMLAGWAGEGWFYAILLVAAYTMSRAIFGSVPVTASLVARFRAGLVTAAAGTGTGLTLGAAGVLPRLSVNAQTHLAGGDYASMGAGGILNPAWSLDQLGIRLLGAGYGQRSAALGGAVIVLALLAPFIVRTGFPAIFFVVLTLIAWTMTQATTPLHQLFYLIPRYQSLHEHDPWRTMALAGIGPAMLSGAAVDRLTWWGGRRSLMPLTVLPVLLMAVAGVWLRREGLVVGWSPYISAIVATALVVIVVATPGRVRIRRRPIPILPAFPILLLLVVVQPIGAELTGSWLGWPADASWAPHWETNPAADAALDTEVSTAPLDGAARFLQDRQETDEPFRYAGYGGVGYPGDEATGGSYMGRRFDPNIQALLVNGRPVFLGLYDIQGYDPLQLARYAEFLAALNGGSLDYHVAYVLPSGAASPMLDLVDVQYIVVDRHLPPDRDDVAALGTGRTEVYRDDQVVVYSRTRNLPHAWIVHDVETVEYGEALARLSSGQVDPYRTALVEGQPPVMPTEPPSGPESAVVLAYLPDAMSVATSGAIAGFLVVSEVYAEGWSAYVDGERTEILPTDHVLRGIPIPAGEHLVEFRYEPHSLKLGLIISGVATVLMLGAFGRSTYRMVRLVP